MERSYPVVLLLGLVLGFSLSGATITLTCTPSSMPALTPGSQTSTGTLTCPQFNPVLGNLTGYTIQSLGSRPTVAASGWLTVENSSLFDLVLTSNRSVELGPRVQLVYSGLPGHSDFAGLGTVSVNGPVNLLVGQTQTFTVNAQGASIAMTLLDFRPTLTQSLASYIGPGTFQAGISTTIILPPPGPWTLSYPDYSVVPDPSISIVYRYDEVPESATALTFAAALGLLVVLRRSAPGRFHRRTNDLRKLPICGNLEV